MTTYVIEFSHGGWYDGIGGVEAKPSNAYTYKAEHLHIAKEDADWLNNSSFHKNMWSVKKIEAKEEKEANG
jgi:hypothetical protein